MDIQFQDDTVRNRLTALQSVCSRATQLPGIRRTMTQIAQRTQRKAVQLAPVREGTLRHSADHTITANNRGLMATVSFGGMAEAYAEVQHEHEEFNHPKGGQAHYLYGSSSSAFGDEGEKFAREALAASLQRELDKVARGG